MARQLRLKVRQAAKSDRTRWLEDLVASGELGASKKFRRGKAVKQGRLKNACGGLTFSENRAFTFAEHLEQIQWNVRPTSLILGQGDCLGQLPVSNNGFGRHELRLAIKGMSIGKATKIYDIPIEIFKALAIQPDTSLQPLLDLCNHHCIYFHDLQEGRPRRPKQLQTDLPVERCLQAFCVDAQAMSVGCRG